MTLVNLGTYPPKQCGIATFSYDLRNSLLGHGSKVQLIAVSDESYKYDYSDDVVLNIIQHRKQDYIRAAAYINKSPQVQLLILQHEYGIYGGSDGEYILDLVKLLHKPFVLITHTVLPQPTKNQKQILNHLCHRAAGIVCMTQKSAHLLADLYEAPSELISVIAHGVPEFPKSSQTALKRKHGLSGCNIISTFGLIGPGKGLELGIKAVANLTAEYPGLKYLVLGQTHPMLKKYEGEKYRQMLVDLVAELHLEDRVLFINKYLSDEELGEYLYMTDIYLSPYPNRDQAVSGTLAFAMGCGRAIVSTSYAFATEILQGGRGLLAKEPDPEELSGLIKQILLDQRLKEKLQKKAWELGRTWTWPNVGKQYTNFFSSILNQDQALEDRLINYAKL